MKMTLICSFLVLTLSCISSTIDTFNNNINSTESSESDSREPLNTVWQTGSGVVVDDRIGFHRYGHENEQLTFFESTPGLLILIALMISAICVVGIFVYKFISKRQGQGYGILKDREHEH